ncbi:MAG: hypothetical protein LBC61_02625 [Candidatus Peribacteria bacterium]|nr:hypothetical protein [Candidatus Peribacteria bacterium]
MVDSQLSRTNIFSQNSIVDLKLVDESSGEIVNDVYLYPHTFIKFTPAQNKNVK